MIGFKLDGIDPKTWGQLKLLQQQVKFIVTKGDTNTLDAMLDLSVDRIVNKVLYHLSKLPIHNSFVILQSRFVKLLDYGRFSLHLDNWFEKTD